MYKQYWTLTDIILDPGRSYVKLVAITYHAVHLWCRVTTETPRIHSRTVERRGVTFNSELYFCFVAYNDVEQAEPSDTYIHTFVLFDYPICTTKSFFLWGRILGLRSPSTSCIFTYHHAAGIINWDNEIMAKPVIHPAPKTYPPTLSSLKATPTIRAA